MGICRMQKSASGLTPTVQTTISLWASWSFKVIIAGSSAFRIASRIQQIFKKQPGFRFQIGIHIAMPVQMILTEIGKDSDIYAKSCHPVLIWPVAGGFKGSMSDPRFCQIMKQGKQIFCCRCGQIGCAAGQFSNRAGNAQSTNAGSMPGGTLQIWRIYSTIDVLPFVPVTPTSISGRAGYIAAQIRA